MIAFLVTVRTSAGPVLYVTQAAHSFDAHAAAIDRFGLCAISVQVKP